MKELVERMQQGDQQAFSEIYDRFSPALYGVAFRMVQDKDIASDIVQESFVKIWRFAQQYSSEKGTFFTWMLNISRNTGIDYLRKSRKEVNYKIQMTADNVGLETQSRQQVETIGLTELLEKLPDEQRIIIDYLYYKGYTQQETADELGIPLGTVKTRARSAIMGMKGYFNILLLLWIFRHI